MELDQIAAALERAHPGWLVVPGYYSRQFTAVPGPSYPYLDSGMIIATDPTELERRMALVEAATKNATGQAGDVHVMRTPQSPVMNPSEPGQRLPG
jgi:hypothetical protein